MSKMLVLKIVGSFILVLALINGVAAIVKEQEANKKTEAKITEQVAENTCQEAANLKTQGRDITVVSADSYNPQFSSTETTYTLSWSGKAKDGNNPAFVCELSGTKDSPKIEMLQMGSETLI